MLLAIIPARGGSQRIRNKNITEFCGKPLMTYSLDAARHAGIFDEIHVSTDSQIIADVATDAGFPVLFFRDPKLADSHTGLIPVLEWVVNEYQKLGRSFSDICLLYPTAPLIESNDLIAAYDCFKKREREFPLLSVSEFSVPVEWAMEIDSTGCAIPRYPEKLNVRSQDLKKCFYDTGSFMFLTISQLVHWDETTDIKYIAYPLPKCRSVDIDDQDDLELAEILYRGNHSRDSSS
ncbi:MAG: pseudaminic acid cytidylyltransferase [Methanoregula sp.]|jgi:N-acylneuraminate cytidylyltransferase|nr:pseudaminic acid cytidylyltransferase [Methanoregula sp.]